MALIPAQQKFHTLTSSTVTQDLGSARANSGREVYTMQDIIDTVNTGSSGIDGFGVQYAVPVFTAFKTVSSLGIGTTGQVLTSAGPGSNPSFQTPAQSVDGFGQPFEMPVWQDFDTLTSIGGGQTGQVLTSTGPGSNPSFQTPAQSVDGFGQPFEMPVWQDFDTLTSIGIGTAGQVLTSAGPGANPSFQTPGGGGGSTDLLNATVTLTGTQVRSLNGGGTVELIAAPGANQVIEVISIVSYLQVGAANVRYDFLALTGLGQRVGYSQGSSTGSNIDYQNFFNALGTAMEAVPLGAGLTPSLNTSVVLAATSQMQVTQGDTPVVFSIAYRLIDFN